jgi:hypothetical protein
MKGAAPVEIAETQRKELASTGYRVLKAGKPLVDLWFRSVVPTADPRLGQGIRYGTLIPGSLIGAVRVHEGASDFKGQKIAPGLYTLRYAVQPDDGDHLDVTESRDFLLLCDAVADTGSGALDAKALQTLSARINAKKHPAVLYLASLKGGVRPALDSETSPQKTVLEVEIAASNGKPIGLALVVDGKAE